MAVGRADLGGTARSRLAENVSQVGTAARLAQ
jgi:hypothetical protein